MNQSIMLRTAVAYALMGSLSAAALANPLTDASDPAYVERTVLPDNAKAKAEAPSLAALRAIPVEGFTLTDAQATPEAKSLYRYLRAVPQTGHVIYGHENDVHHKMFRPEHGSESDTKDITGSIAGVVGFDALSLVGDELRLNDCEWNMGVTYVDKMADITKKAAEDGAILTLSMHMPNFALVDKKTKAAGEVDYTKYSAHIADGNVVPRILPGGDLNSYYTGYLDIIADYAHRMQENKIPVIFRPLHEQNGSWFWWGKTHCKDKEFQQLWEYTVTYLRDTKGVHNFLYAYSPNGPFATEAEYLDRYPGDAWADILGIDTYDDDQSGQWYKNLDASLDVIGELAKKRSKVIAITEAGVRKDGSLALTGNVDKNWFSKTAAIACKHHAAYFMTWSNFEKLPHNFFAPFMVSQTRGHEMIDSFTAFYNLPSTLFADGIADYRKL